MPERNNDLRLAVLIDADNVPYANVTAMMEEIAKYGTPTFKRIYADWTKPTTSGWKTVLLQNAITPIQQYSYTQGKNATDSAMIIDAMDILYSGRVDGFCIVSSDSDFTRLATRLREAGMKVIGIGEKKTPDPFITACDKFIYIEILSADDTTTDSKSPRTRKQSAPDPRVIRLIKTSVNDVADEDGWAFLGEIGTLLLKKQPNFDPRNYGFKKLVSLMKSIKDLEIDERISENGRTRHVYVRVKP
jgi:hypothetical protein